MWNSIGNLKKIVAILLLKGIVANLHFILTGYEYWPNGRLWLQSDYNLIYISVTSRVAITSSLTQSSVNCLPCILRTN